MDMGVIGGGPISHHVCPARIIAHSWIWGDVVVEHVILWRFQLGLYQRHSVTDADLGNNI